MAALTLEALPKNVVVADSVGKARPASFLLRSASEPHLNYMFSKYDHLSGRDSLEFSPSSSRSPSPNGKDESIFSNPEDDNSSTSTNGSSTPKRPAPVLERRHTLQRSPEQLSSSSSSLRSLKLKKRPPSVAFMKAPAAEGQVVTLSSHRSNSSVSLSSLGNTSPKKDELWIGFKALESDYSKFNCKSILQRTHILRSSLIPFLRKFDGSTSTVPIDIHELDRRIRTLNKWWILLLASLRANGANMIPVQDKSTYLEGVIGILSRPEWRGAPSSLAPLSTRNPSPSNSCSSLSSASSASSTISYEKSLQHDMKVMYTTSLLDTLAFTLEGMSEQQCGGLVHFAGKVIAYSFFFVNGVSEMLIGLLGLKAPQLRKVLNEYGIGRGMDLQAVAEGVIGEFPHSVHSVGFTTMSAALPRLKKPGNYMVATSNIDWKGPWVSRWTGRETDMFFVFAKHYHLLLAEYLPVGISATARLCAPGFLFIQAQLLSLLETAIHRGPPHLSQSENSSANVTFDDIVGAQIVNGNGNAMQQAPSKTMYRPLMDQRIFSLLKDITLDKNFNDAMRDVFATAFANLLKSLAKNTKIVEHSACVSLCDLLEEGIPALYQFEQQSETGAKYIDWPFWVEVSKQMMKNENSMTELRLFSFIYVVWDLIAEDPERKRSVSLDWILSESMWNRFFSHWCPMVRAFYMRLLCWRVGRLSGQGSNGEASLTPDGVEISTTSCDSEIFETLLMRLNESHAAFMFLRDESDRNSTVRPSAVPCPPAPNRKLAIIRVESQPGFGRPFSLDKMMPAQTEQPKPAPAPTKPVQTQSEPNGESNGGSVIKRRWSLLRNFLGAAEALKPDASPTPQPKVIPVAPQSASRPTNSNYVPPRTSSGKDAWQSTKVPYGAAFGNRNRMQFKFVLEFTDRPPHARKGKSNNLPRLPRLTQDWYDAINESKELPQVGPLALTGATPQNWKYFGRALSEWSLVVDEIDNFVERRKNEGIRDVRDSEIPILSVDSLRKG